MIKEERVICRAIVNKDDDVYDVHFGPLIQAASINWSLVCWYTNIS